MPRMLVVDSKRPDAYRRGAATAVKPNYGEACRLLGERERRSLGRGPRRWPPRGRDCWS